MEDKQGRAKNSASSISSSNIVQANKEENWMPSSEVQKIYRIKRTKEKIEHQRVLLPKEKFFKKEEDEDSEHESGASINEMQLETWKEQTIVERIKEASEDDDFLMQIRKALQEGKTEFSKVALGLCE